jgi:polysaccharide biosynthesis protein
MDDKRTLKQSVFSGLIWTFGERIIAQGISFILSIILARLLLPEEYGIIAIVLVFINLANVFVSNGFGEALVQKKNADNTDFSTAFYCSLAVAVVLYVALFLAAPLIAKIYRYNDLILVLRVLSLKIIISSVSTIQHAYVSRKMIFKRFFFSTIGGTLVSAVVGIGMAYAGLGVWALVAQYLVNTVIDTVILFITIPWRPSLSFSTQAAKRIVSYGWKITASALINTGYSELRNLVIGGFYTTTDLAFYNRGNQFPSLVITNIDTAIGKVVFPAMAQSNDDKIRLKAVSRRALKTTSYLIFPLLIGLMAIARPLVMILLTEKWEPCIFFLQVGCIFFMCQPIQTTNWQIIKAVGRSDLCFKLEVLKKAIGISMLIVSIAFGVKAIAVMSAIFGVISMIINMVPNGKLINYTVKEQMLDFLPALTISILMGILVHTVTLLEFNSILTLVLQLIVGILTYIGSSIIFKIDSFVYLLDTIKGFSKKGKC